MHLDIHADDLEAALGRAFDAGAKKEQVFNNAKHGSAAFGSDPFVMALSHIEEPIAKWHKREVASTTNVHVLSVQ